VRDGRGWSIAVFSGRITHRSIAMSVLRSVGALIAGLVAAMALIVAVEVVSMMVHPFPPGVDPSDFEVCAAHVAKLPAGVLALGVAGWGLTALVGAWVATRLGTNRHPAHGIVIGALLFLGAAFNMYMLPYAAWFKVANVVVLPLATLWGVRLGRGSAQVQSEAGEARG
jgi:hypothetical protein